MSRKDRRVLWKKVMAKHWRDVWRFTHEGLRVETPEGHLIAFYEGL